MPSIIDRWKYKCRFLPFRNQTHWCLWASVNMGIRVYFTATLSMPSSSALWLESFRTTNLLYAVTQPQYHASLVVKLLIKSLVFRCKAWKHFSNSIENICVCLPVGWLVLFGRSIGWLCWNEHFILSKQNAPQNMNDTEWASESKRTVPNCIDESRVWKWIRTKR